ncbi:protein-disulfide reductase DsbD family protein [Lacipirellula sp.]|uniref:protein-disulfide reductase DsbD family protein n=1 Tax=Lacipirellula sp. TaxID=2691419 RepID=UPI003D10E6BE
MTLTRRFGNFAWLATALFALALLPTAAAQELDFSKFDSKLGGGLGGGFGQTHKEVSISAEFTAPTPDAPAMLFVTAKMAPNWHISSIDQGADGSGGGPKPTVINIDGGQEVKLLAPFQHIQQPTSRIDNEAWIGLELREHRDVVTWYAPVEFAASIDPANASINGKIDGQVCDRSCIPFNMTFTAKLGQGTAIPATPAAVVPAPIQSISYWSLVGSGILGGLILNLMPCVLPVIGLKLFSFAKQGGQSRLHNIWLNLAYTAGLLTVFMVLATLSAGVQLGLSGKGMGWGEIYTYTSFKVAMTALVFAMALSFLGVWEVPIPGFATTGSATDLASKDGPGGAYFMGIITTLLAVPCSGPFLGPLFGYTISQPPIVTYLLFFSIGLGMALPYLIAGAFPAAVSWLPKPGAWMDTLKNLMGFVLLATVVYLFSTLGDKYFLPTLALMFGIWFACWLIGRVPAYAERKQRLKAWGWGTAVAAAVGVTAFMLTVPSKYALAWEPFSPQAVAVARAQGKTVLVDFTANWCLTCKLNLATAINRKDVKEVVEANDVVTLLADWTDQNDTVKNALTELNSQSIPLMAIYPSDPNKEVLVLRDVITQSQVLEALAEAGPSLDPKTAAVTSEKK